MEASVARMAIFTLYMRPDGSGETIIELQVVRAKIAR